MGVHHRDDYHELLMLFDNEMNAIRELSERNYSHFSMPLCEGQRKLLQITGGLSQLRKKGVSKATRYLSIVTDRAGYVIFNGWSMDDREPPHLELRLSSRVLKSLTASGLLR